MTIFPLKSNAFRQREQTRSESSRKKSKRKGNSVNNSIKIKIDQDDLRVTIESTTPKSNEKSDSDTDVSKTSVLPTDACCKSRNEPCVQTQETKIDFTLTNWIKIIALIIVCLLFRRKKFRKKILLTLINILI